MLSADYLARDPLLNICVTEPLRRGTAQVVSECERGVLIYDRQGELFVLSAADEETADKLLAAAEGRDVRNLLLCDARHEPLTARFGLGGRMTCRQAAYYKKEPPEADPRLVIAPADDDAMRVILSRYSIDPPEVLMRQRARGELFFARDKSGCDIGFVGLHPEGCFGLLEVLEDRRRQGYGEALERFILRYMMARGLTPYCQIEPDNFESFALQDKLGLETHEQIMVFLWREEAR